MFLCRRLLLRVHFIPTLGSYNRSISQRFFSDGIRDTITPTSIPPNSTEPFATSFKSKLEQHPANDHSATSSEDISDLLCTFPRSHKLLGLSSQLSAANLYTELRGRDLVHIANLPLGAFQRVLIETAHNKNYDLLETICKDILEVFQGRHSHRLWLLRWILLKEDLTKLSVNTLVSMLVYCNKHSRYLAQQVMERAVRTVADREGDVPLELVQFLHPILIRRLGRLTVPSGARILGYAPPALVYSAFKYTHKLLISRQESLALEMLQVLIQRSWIPMEVLQTLHSTGTDLHAEANSTIIRAILYWNWRHLAASLLLNLLRSSKSPNSYVFELAVDTSYALLDTPTRTDVQDCLLLMMEMHRFSYIPSGLVRHFYCCAAEQLLGEEAVAFYSFSRTPEILRQHRYPPPQGTALSWLMHHLTNMSKKTHISRLLATEVVEDNLHILPQFRSRFISLTAFRGYSLLARKLWERYSVGKDKDLVVGNPGLMVRMTSILAHLIRRVKLSLRSSQGRNAEVEVEMLEHQLQDLTLFQRRVLGEFRASNEPLTDAPHAVITSFARACFIVGDITEGFKLLKLILRRKEVPDMYDVNVALTALAEHDHRTAAQILERMLAKKIQPDVVSYATVMHYAQLRNDKEMVDKMIERIRVSNDTQLSLKSVASLIRATVDFENEDTQSTKQAKLQTAMEIIRTLTPDKFLRSQQIGKYLVAASLRANDGGMAYRFWRLLIRQSTEWEDREQVFQRRLIIQAVERQMKEGRIEKGAGKWMVTRLRHRFEADLGR